MNIIIGTSLSEKNRLNKTFNQIANISGQLTEDSNIVNPTILLSYNDAYVNANYIYIPAWNRYYFITDITVTNGMMRVSMHCDVLMSFKNDIRSSTAHIVRSRQGNKYIADALATQTNQTAWQFRELGTCLNAECNYILIKAGV